jgi:hypothetical protein
VEVCLLSLSKGASLTTTIELDCSIGSDSFFSYLFKAIVKTPGSSFASLNLLALTFKFSSILGDPSFDSYYSSSSVCKIGSKIVFFSNSFFEFYVEE